MPGGPAGCQNYWTINPTYHECRPGKSGEVTVRVMDAYGENEIDDECCTVKVDAHGWVTVHQDGKKVTVKSKHKGGSVREECHMEIVSDPNRP